MASTIDDPEHSDVEDRFMIVGLTSRMRLAVVVFTDRGDRIRIISARLANSRERRKYEEYDAD